jgi:5-methylcytosine-specific restriction endonuclease McrA
MGLYRAASETGRVKVAMHWRFVLVAYLRERDGDRCALCRKIMCFESSTGPRGESAKGATVDHIVPRSLGGSDDLVNLQLAHWSCNRAKGNRSGFQQLRLVG